MRWRGLLACLLVFSGAACSPLTAVPNGVPIPTPTHPVTPGTTLPLPSLTTSELRLETEEPGPALPQDTQTPFQNPPIVSSVQEFPDAAAFTWQAIASGLASPVSLAHTRDGSSRLFIVEQAGVIRLLKDGQLASQVFLDIRQRVGSQANEQGLLGLDFHPRFSENGFFYVNYTDLNGDTVIARFKAVGDDADRADESSEAQLLKIPQPYANHNGGSVVFGPEGYLYLGLGDGGSGGDPHGNGQSLDSLLGKLLRLDVDQGEPYTIPPDNPFAQGSGLPEIWAYGLRNPWRFSFDRVSGDLYIGDVGQTAWEEIDYLAGGQPGGINFGWNFLEGSHPYQGSPTAGLRLEAPIYEYSHAEGCSVTGGVVYRGTELPEWQGVYLFGDYCTGWVGGLLRGADGAWKMTHLFDLGVQIASFGEDEGGEVYLADRNGQIFKLVRR